MATNARRSIIFAIVWLLLLSTGNSKKHHFKAENDARPQFDFVTFGLLTNGYLSVDLTAFNVNVDLSQAVGEKSFGFTLDKTMSTGVSPYLGSGSRSCVFSDAIKSTQRKMSLVKDTSISVIFFKMDFVNKKLLIERRGDDVKNVMISTMPVADYERMQYKHVVVANAHAPPTTVAPPVKVSKPKNRRRRAAIMEDQPSQAILSTTAPSGDEAKKVFSENEAKKNVLSGNEVNKVVSGNEANQVLSKDESTTKTSLASSTTTTTVVTVPATKGVTLPNSKIVDIKNGKNASTMTVAHPTTPARIPTAEDFLNSLVADSIPLTMKDGQYSVYFMIVVETEAEEGLYNLFFHNCWNSYGARKKALVNFKVMLVERNDDNYLSAGDIPLPMLYIIFCFAYFLLGCYWLYVLRRSQDQVVFKIHYLMLVLLYVKSIALFFHSVNMHFIEKTGHHDEAFAILYYITYLMRGTLLFVTIVLIGAGWAFIKYILSDRDKKIFVFVIPLQILANVAQIVLEEKEEGQSEYTMWKQIFFMVDLLCCGAILFPVIWSIRHLQEASQTDGKAAMNLAKLKIFKHFYILIVCYIYFTRIIVYLITMTVPFRYIWIYELFKELSTFAFFTVTGYKFRPATNNPYLRVAQDSDDDDDDVDEIFSQSGAYETVKKVNVHSSSKESTADTTKHRETSLEYD